MSVRIATFNVENLMERFDFSGWRKAVLSDRAQVSEKHRLARDHELLEQARVIAYEDDSRQMTALAIADCQADIICLQEVENLDALESFEKNYLLPMTGLSYPQKEWVQGNDGRGIDVAIMARKESASGEKIELLSIESHANRTFGDMGVHNQALEDMGFEASERLFRRDCLEVNMRVGGKKMTLFVCHFKSMGSSKEGLSGRSYTMPVRVAEAEGVRRIIEDKFGVERTGKMRWLICGDLNDYTERLAIEGNKQAGYRFKLLVEKYSGLDPLFRGGFGKDLVKRRADQDRWSLYYAAGESRNTRDPEARPVRHLVQLDYFLASPAIVKANKEVIPDIIRNGQPYRTVFPPGQDVDRYPRTGWDRPKASDHCPLAVTLKIV